MLKCATCNLSLMTMLSWLHRIGIESKSLLNVGLICVRKAISMESTLQLISFQQISWHPGGKKISNTWYELKNEVIGSKAAKLWRTKPAIFRNKSVTHGMNLKMKLLGAKLLSYGGPNLPYLEINQSINKYMSTSMHKYINKINIHQFKPR